MSWLRKLMPRSMASASARKPYARSRRSWWRGRSKTYTNGGLVECWTDIRLREVTSLEKQRLPSVAGKRISEAIAEVQLCRMTAALAIIAIRLAGDLGLGFGDWRDRYAS